MRNVLSFLKCNVFILVRSYVICMLPNVELRPTNNIPFQKM